MSDREVCYRDAGHFRHRTAYTTARSDPQDLLLIWVRRGELALEVGGSAHSAAAGDLVTLRPSVPHRYRPGTEHGWEWLWLHAGGPGIGEVGRILTTRGPVLSVGEDSVLQARFIELVTAATAAPPLTFAARFHLDSGTASILGLVLLAADHPGPSGAAGRNPLTPLTTWINDHLDAPLTLTALAAAAGWSPAHLSRLTERYLGMSPMRYLTQVRMREARRMLAGSDLPVAEVARRVGFADPLHFSRRFRQVVGVPPSAVRGSPGYAPDPSRIR